ncbi:hypothetical protein H0O02_05550 [Candidatus Micrarchaeota archaeon]|nr:hypothetical protein [Candidatus Micrarchaeota archaeon]
MGRTHFRRNLRRELEIRAKSTKYRPLFDEPDMTNTMNSRRYKLKIKASRHLSENDAKGAEKSLVKMLRRNPKDRYALSKIINLYTDGRRFEDGEKVIESALKRKAADHGVYCSAITLYSMAGKLGKAYELFESAVAGGSADAVLCHRMLTVYTGIGFLEKAEMVFDTAVKNGFGSFLVYAIMTDFYYNRGMYEKTRETIVNAPPILKNSPRFMLMLLEVERKLKNYEKAIIGADELIAKYPKKDFDDEFYVRARTIKAYCMMHSLGKEDATGEFLILKNNVKRNSVHYPRILCGYAFCGPELTGREREQLSAELGLFLHGCRDSVRGKIENAMRLLSIDASQPNP